MNLPTSPSIKKGKLQNQYIQYPLTNTNDFKVQSSPSNKIDFRNIQQPTHLSNQKTNPFLALSQLKATEDQYEMLKKRMQVLKLKEQKNNNRYQLNHRKILLHNSIQKLASIQKQRITQWKNQTDERVQQQRLVNLQQKLIHHKNVQQIVQTIKENKLRQYQQRKQQSIHHSNRIKQIEHQTVQLNKSKVQQIKKLQNFSRLSIQSYNKQKLHQFREKKSKQTGSLSDKKMQKQQEIKKMLQLQMEMLQRQSRSRIMFDKSAEKLKEVLNPQLNLKNSRVGKKSLTKNMQESSTQTNTHLNYELKNQINERKSIDIKLQKNLDSLNKSYSYRSEGIKSDFSLPQIKSSRKYK